MESSVIAVDAPSPVTAAMPVAAAPILPELPAEVLADHAATMSWATQAVQRMGAASSFAPGSVPPLPSIPPAQAFPSAPAPAMRINQLDALALDSELGWMLNSQLRKVFKFLSGGVWIESHKAEMEAVLHAIMFACTVGRDVPTPGMKLQNLQFQNYAAVRDQGRAIQAGWVGVLGGWASKFGLPLPGGSAGSGSRGDGVSRIDALKSMLLPQRHASGSDAARSSSRMSSIPLSHFDPIAPLPDAQDAASMLHDTSIAAAAAAAASSSGAEVPSAVLLSSLPSSAPVGLSLSQKTLYFVASVLLRYAWTKLNHQMTMDGWGGYPEGDWHRRVYKLCRHIEHSYQLLNILNFIAFLKNGSYRTLLERFLSIRLIYLRSRLNRQVSFEFMNQQIAWAALSDFMLFLLPLINFGAMADAAVWVGKKLGLIGSEAAGVAAAGEGEGGAGVASIQAAVDAGCPCCGARPAVQPYVAAPCRHVFCYYCLSGNRMADAQQRRGASGMGAAAARHFECPACQQPIVSQAPLHAHLLLQP